MPPHSTHHTTVGGSGLLPAAPDVEFTPAALKSERAVNIMDPIILTPLWLNVAISLFGLAVNVFAAWDGHKEGSMAKLIVHSALAGVFMTMTVRSVQLVVLFLR